MLVHMGSLGLGCMMRKYVNYNETSTLAPRSEFQMFSGAVWQLKAQIIIMRMASLNCPDEIVDYLTLSVNFYDYFVAVLFLFMTSYL